MKGSPVRVRASAPRKPRRIVDSTTRSSWAVAKRSNRDHLFSADTPSIGATRSAADRVRGARARRPRSVARRAPTAGWASVADGAPWAAASRAQTAAPYASSGNTSSDARPSTGTPQTPRAPRRARTTAGDSRTARHPASCGSVLPSLGGERSLSRIPDDPTLSGLPVLKRTLPQQENLSGEHAVSSD